MTRIYHNNKLINTTKMRIKFTPSLFISLSKVCNKILSLDLLAASVPVSLYFCKLEYL